MTVMPYATLLAPGQLLAVGDAEIPQRSRFANTLDARRTASAT